MTSPALSWALAKLKKSTSPWLFGESDGAAATLFSTAAITAILSSAEYPRPDQAVKLAGVQPEEITDMVISHSHWDHLGGIDLSRKANVWIQKEEFRYYTGDAWPPSGDHRAMDPEDVKELVRINTEGRWRLVDGDDG
jgi:glyoxylase-like metal-dependent hydrolase (beta-lactamase superfamily II)